MPSSSLENKLLQRYLFIMDYSVIRSNRKSLSIEVNSDAKVIVRAPYKVSDVFIDKFVYEKRDWINRAICKVKERQKNNVDVEPLSKEEICELAEKALKIIPEKVKHYANIMGVSYGKITIRNQKTRWGSCSAKRNLNFKGIAYDNRGNAGQLVGCLCTDKGRPKERGIRRYSCDGVGNCLLSAK